MTYYKLARRALDSPRPAAPPYTAIRSADSDNYASGVELRGEFIKKAKERRRDFTVDWVHLKLNDQAQRTVLCKDPFKAVDERVQRLIESM